MCDTIVAVPPATRDGSVWFGKNSDREPGEAQLVDHLPSANFAAGTNVTCTYITIPQARQTNEVLISRPFWMWGAEMGANSHGVAIGNEAVFTRLPYDKVGLTGMDLLRLALERASTAAESLDVITSLLTRHGQGGGCGYRNRSFRYHNAFVIADPTEAFVLETAGPFWAAQKVRGIRTISNALSIGADFDLISKDAYPFARSKGWCRSSADFDFAACFGNPRYTFMSGAIQRRTCTLSRLTASTGTLGFDEFAATLRDHSGLYPSAGRRMQMPCAHASWWPTRHDGQTSGSMISRLSAQGSIHWLTGTSSPCLSVFKPALIDGTLLSTGPPAAGAYDSESLFWRHERLHRIVLMDYKRYSSLFDQERGDLEASSLSLINSGPGLPQDSRQYVLDEGGQSGQYQAIWEQHRQIIPEWTNRILANYKPASRVSLFQRYWKKQRKLDQLPIESAIADTGSAASRNALDSGAI
jgi:secernin